MPSPIVTPLTILHALKISALISLQQLYQVYDMLSATLLILAAYVFHSTCLPSRVLPPPPLSEPCPCHFGDSVLKSTASRSHTVQVPLWFKQPVSFCLFVFRLSLCRFSRHDSLLFSIWSPRSLPTSQRIRLFPRPRNIHIHPRPTKMQTHATRRLFFYILCILCTLSLLFSTFLQLSVPARFTRTSIRRSCVLVTPSLAWKEAKLRLVGYSMPFDIDFLLSMVFSSIVNYWMLRVLLLALMLDCFSFGLNYVI